MNEILSTLFKSAETGEHQLVEKILFEQPDLVNKENEHGLTLLGIASHYGQIEVVKVLIKYNVEINALSHSKLSFIPSNTALHAAIAGVKSLEVIDYLLIHGADSNLKDSEGYTPLHIAAFEGNLLIAKKLLQYGAKIFVSDSGKTPIDLAQEHHHLEFVNLLNTTVN